MTQKKVIIRQIRSSIGQRSEVKDSLRSLGLGRIGKQKEFTLDSSVSGMVRRVGHLVEIQPTK